MNLSKLKEPFPADDLEWRVQSSGKKGDRIWAMVLTYVTNRAIMDRLDNVVGPENWKNEYKPGPEGGVICGLSIRIGDEWVTKWDGADNTQVEAIKGGLSGAMKRAAVQWGIGRYLYRLDATFAEISERGSHKDKLKDGTWFRWNPPKLPDWALPQQQTRPAAKPRQQPDEDQRAMELEASLQTAEHDIRRQRDPESLKGEFARWYKWAKPIGDGPVKRVQAAYEKRKREIDDSDKKLGAKGSDGRWGDQYSEGYAKERA